MEFKNIKIGIKLKLVKRINSETYHHLKIGDILTIECEQGNNEFHFKKLNEELYYVNETLAYCWEPVIQSLMELIE